MLNELVPLSAVFISELIWLGHISVALADDQRKVHVKLEIKKAMKAKHLSLAIAALLGAGGLWLTRSAWRTPMFHKSSMDVGSQAPHGPPKPGQMLNSPARLAPPDPNRRFADFTPEQRVQFARKGHGPGG
jgi:hypothetical protein